MTLPPSYDYWVTSGNYRDTTFLLKCSNPSCSEYGVVIEVPGFIEYGCGSAERDHCECCNGTLVDANEYLPSLEDLLELEELKREGAL